MTLTKLSDDLNTHFFEKKEKQKIKNYYLSDDLRDIFKVMDYVNFGLVFDEKCCSFTGLQSYLIFLRETITLKEDENNLFFISSFNNPFKAQQILVTLEDYHCLKRKENSLNEDESLILRDAYNSVFFIGSGFSLPLLKDLDPVFFQKRKKEKKSLKSILTKNSNFPTKVFRPSFA